MRKENVRFKNKIECTRLRNEMMGMKMSRSVSVDDVADVELVLLRSSFSRAREDVRERESAQVVQRDPASTSHHSAPTSYKGKNKPVCRLH